MIPHQLPLKTVLTGIDVEGPSFAKDSGEQNEAAGIGIGKRSEEEDVHDRINGRIRPDAEAERGENCDRKGRAFREHSQSMAHVLIKAFKNFDAVHLIDLLANESRVSELAVRGLACLFKRHSAGHVFFSFDFEVSLNFTRPHVIPVPAVKETAPTHITPTLRRAAKPDLQRGPTDPNGSYVRGAVCVRQQ